MSDATPSPPKQTLSAGEYCTLVRAEELGILNKEEAKKGGVAPFNPLYKDVKTFNPSVDAQDRRSKSLCKATLDGKEAYPHCTEMHGPGFVKVGSADQNQPFKCEVYDCPPGFTRQGQYCSKEPLFADAKIDKRARCDERWYDWFLIPNYHLGNKFHEEKVGKCYAPCPVRHVPSFATDPVDGSRADLSSDDALDKCVPRDMYFAGKYEEGTDYCPLAWIMRIYASNPKHAKDLLLAKRKKIADMYGNDKDPSKSRLTKQFLAVSRVDGTDVSKEAQFLSSQVGRYLDNVEIPSGPMQQACSAMNKKEHLDMAYKVCKELNDNGSIQISADPNKNAKENIVLRQACNAVFCNDTEDALDIIGQDPICFTKQPTLSEDDLTAEKEAPAPMFDNQERFMNRSLQNFLWFVFVPIFITLGFFAWTRFIWPKLIRPIFFLYMRIFMGRKFAALQFRETRMAEIEQVRGQILRAAKK